MTDLLAAVDAAFVGTSRGLRQWDDPHAGEMPAEEEYSRCLDPAKWRIIGARADAWIDALVTDELATVDHDVELEWPADGPRPSRSDLVIPRAHGALSLALGRSGIDDVADAGVVIGVARNRQLLAMVGFVPDCGCDACDRGSADVLDVIDDWIGSIVAGTFRRLARGDADITITGGGWSARNLLRTRGLRSRPIVDRILADPTGWDEVSGNPWS